MLHLCDWDMTPINEYLLRELGYFEIEKYTLKLLLYSLLSTMRLVLNGDFQIRYIFVAQGAPNMQEVRVGGPKKIWVRVHSQAREISFSL